MRSLGLLQGQSKGRSVFHVSFCPGRGWPNKDCAHGHVCACACMYTCVLWGGACGFHYIRSRFCPKKCRSQQASKSEKVNEIRTADHCTGTGLLLPVAVYAAVGLQSSCWASLGLSFFGFASLCHEDRPAALRALGSLFRSLSVALSVREMPLIIAFTWPTPLEITKRGLPGTTAAFRGLCPGAAVLAASPSARASWSCGEGQVRSAFTDRGASFPPRLPLVCIL